MAFELGSVALCLQYQGRAAAALPKFEEALAMDQRIFKGDHPDVATALCNAAFCLDFLERSTEALPQHEAALAMRQRIYKGDHPEVVTSIGNLGLCLEHLGRFEEALGRHDEALAMSRRIYQADNIELARRLNNRALCLKSMGRWSEALNDEEASLAMCQRIYRGDHANVAAVLNAAGDSLNALDRSEAAIQKYQQAEAMFLRLDIAQPVNNIVRNGLAKSRLKLGDLFAETGKAGEAGTNYQSGLTMAESVLAGDAGNDGAKRLRSSFRIKLGLETAEVVVHKIVPRSQAEQVGLRAGDVLVRYAGKPVASAADLPCLTGRAKGTEIALEIRRDGAPLKLTVKAGPLGSRCEDRVLPVKAKGS
jgi:tetratricopeptide (TPR) repeat protein